MRRIFFTLLPIFFFACQSQPEIMVKGALHLSAQPVAGQDISFWYHQEKTSIAGESPLRITLYYTVGKTIYAERLQNKDTNGIAHAVFKLPDSAQSFALKFQAKYTDRNGGEGYVFPLYNRSGKWVKGALAGASLFYNKRQSLLRLSQQPDTALSLLQKEFKAYPQVKEKWMGLYLNTVFQVKKNNAYSDIHQELETFLSESKVKKGYYHLAYNLYQKMDMDEKADSIKTIGLKRYPSGGLAKYEALRAFNHQEQIDSLLKYYRKFKSQFIKETDLQKNTRILDMMGSRIALYYSKQNNYKAYLSVVSEIKSPIEKASDYINVATSLYGTKTNLSFADSLLSVALPLIRNSIDYPGAEKPTYITVENWRQQMRRSYGLNADTYAMILFEEGKLKDALHYQRIAVGIFDGTKMDMNERYIKYLIAYKNYPLAKKQIEKFFSDGYSSPQLKKYLKEVNLKLKAKS